MSAIVARGLGKRFGAVRALEGIDIEIQAGELVGLIGHNGAGKTTFLRLVTGQLRPTEGSVRVDGVDAGADPGEVRRHLGYVPESPALYDYLTAREFLELVAELRGGGDVGAALELSGLGADADRLVREYSQGMRRKTAIAAAVLGEPPVLVLDEALNGLDPPSAARVKARLRQVCDGGATVLLSTHALGTVERLADRVVMLAHGRVAGDHPARELAGLDLEKLFLERMGG